MQATLSSQNTDVSTNKTHSRQVKWLKEFRLLSASVILGNRGYTEQIQNDASCKADIFELCDQYSLCIFINWIATKYGFPLCPQSIQSGDNGTTLPLLQIAPLADLYPLALPDSLVRCDSTTAELFRFLDNRWQADLFLVSALYQHILSHQLTLLANGKVDIHRNSDGRQSGEFYTPAIVVNYCLERVLNLDSSDLMKRIKDSTIDTIDVEPQCKRQFKMLDPACGTGNFLIGAIDWLRHSGLNDAQTFHFTCHCVFGKDIDARAIDVCRLLLILSCSRHLNQVRLSEGESEFISALTRLLTRISRNIRVENSVLNTGVTAEYDLVIGNPPYVSFGSRNQQTLTVEWQKFLRTLFPASTEYKIRLYSVFQELALRAAQQGGYVTLLVPDAFLNGSYYQKLRRLILAESDIVSLSELPSNAIAGAVVGNWCVACYRKRSGGHAANEPVSLYRVTELPTAIQHFSVTQDVLVSPDKSRFQLVFCEQDAAILKSIAALPPLKEQLRGHTGLRARNGQASIISSTRPSSRHKRGITSGARVHQYSVEEEEVFLDVDPKKLFAGGFDKDIVEQPKILMRQTADRIIAAVDLDCRYHLNNVHSFSPVQAGDRSELNYLCGVLNSSLFLHLYRLKSREEGRALAQIDIEMIEAMPLPDGSGLLKRRIADAAAALAGNQPPLEQEHLLEVIDQCVYKLFSLSDNLIAHVEKSVGKGTSKSCYATKK